MLQDRRDGHDVADRVPPAARERQHTVSLQRASPDGAAVGAPPQAALSAVHWATLRSCSTRSHPALAPASGPRPATPAHRRALHGRQDRPPRPQTRYLAWGSGVVRAGRSRANGVMSTLGAVVQGQVGQGPAEEGGELEAVGGAERDEHAVVAGQRAEDEVAVRGQGVEAGRGVVVGAGGGREAGAQEPGQAVGGGRVGVEAAGGGGDLVAADVLGGLEGGAWPDREAVEAGVVHPDPDREPADGEGVRVGRAEVAELLLGDDQGQAAPSWATRSPVQASVQSSTRPARKLASAVATSTEPPWSRTAVTGAPVAQGGAVARWPGAAWPGAAGGRDDARRRPARGRGRPGRGGRPASGASPRRRPATRRGRRRPRGWPGRGRADRRAGREHVDAAGGRHEPLARPPAPARPRPA